jgi:hypothetical protein
VCVEIHLLLLDARSEETETKGSNSTHNIIRRVQQADKRIDRRRLVPDPGLLHFAHEKTSSGTTTLYAELDRNRCTGGARARLPFTFCFATLLVAEVCKSVKET